MKKLTENIKHFHLSYNSGDKIEVLRDINFHLASDTLADFIRSSRRSGENLISDSIFAT